VCEWYGIPVALTSAGVRLALSALLLALVPVSGRAQVDSGTYVIHDFQFADGEKLAELRLHYLALGSNNRPGVLILHGTGGSHRQFLSPIFAGELFGRGQPLDTATHFIVLADGIGHGGSSKPSDGLHAQFPHYTYDDMVQAQYRLVTERLHLRHLRVVLGTSMGCMHAWVWAETYPDFMDGIVPLACLPTQIAGRNRLWRKLAIDAIRMDPGWNAGEYTAEPRGLATVQALVLMVGGSPSYYQRLGPTRDSADAYLTGFYRRMREGGFADANDALYALDASRVYDPSTRLDWITARVLAINFADDQINPPELGIMERLMPRVKRAKYVLVPADERTVGHGTHTKAAVWKQYLSAFLEQLPR
jgi:homoserine O-acetyltransferase